MSSLRDQIDAAMHGYMCPDCELIPAFDAVMAVVQPALDAKDAEIERLKLDLREYQQANTKLQEISLRRNEEARRANERADQAEAERDRLKAAIEKAVREDDQCGGACEYGQPCPYLPDLEDALDQPEQNGTTRNEAE